MVFSTGERVLWIETSTAGEYVQVTASTSGR